MSLMDQGWIRTPKVDNIGSKALQHTGTVVGKCAKLLCVKQAFKKQQNRK